MQYFITELKTLELTQLDLLLYTLNEVYIDVKMKIYIQIS